MKINNELKPQDLGITENELKSLFMKYKIGAYSTDANGTTFYIGERGKIRLMEVLSHERD